MIGYKGINFSWLLVAPYASISITVISFVNFTIISYLFNFIFPTREKYFSTHTHSVHMLELLLISY